MISKLSYPNIRTFKYKKIEIFNIYCALIKIVMSIEKAHYTNYYGTNLNGIKTNNIQNSNLNYQLGYTNQSNSNISTSSNVYITHSYFGNSNLNVINSCIG